MQIMLDSPTHCLGTCGILEVCSREFVCEHVVAMRLMLGEVTLPPEHAPLKGKKKRNLGRPAKETRGGVRFGKYHNFGCFKITGWSLSDSALLFVRRYGLIIQKYSLLLIACAVFWGVHH